MYGLVPTQSTAIPRPPSAARDTVLLVTSGSPRPLHSSFYGDYASNTTSANWYSVVAGEVTPTDLAAELLWNLRGINVRSLARSFRVAPRPVEREVAKLNSMRNAEAGWDGYRAVQPDVRTIDLAIRFLRRLSRTGIASPAATMSSSGKAALFDANDRYYLDAEFEPNGQVSWLFQPAGGKETEGEERFDGEVLPQRLLGLLRSASDESMS
jgi:hypothetical protein